MNEFRSIIKSLFIVIFIMICYNVCGQIFDDFEDDDFTSNPTWFGDISKFQITSSSAIPEELKPALQLFSEGTDTSVLFLPNSLMMNTEWRFWIKLSFNTSANNFAKVYLVSDQDDLRGSLNGYFVQIGGQNDSIGLYKQTGMISEKIISSSNAFTGNSTNIFRIKVIRDPFGVWTLYTASGGGFDFFNEGSTTDNTFLITDYFGIWCKYTASNATKFYFDDFFVNENVIDTIPPEVFTLNVPALNQLYIEFSESVEINSAQNTFNYHINATENPVSAVRDLINFSVVHLVFEQDFTPDTTYFLTVTDIADLNGNMLVDTVIEFTVASDIPVNPYDIVINEIMTDVNPPPSGLPEVDFLELYNRTDHAINLENYTIKPRESANPIVLPAVWIEPDSFLMVVKNTDVALFEAYGPTIGLPGFSMNNEGSIVLRDPFGSLICSVTYNDDWYHDAIKKQGGWSLEQIDTDNPCAGKDNWTASIDLNGGTPGHDNSVKSVTFSSPEIVQAEITGNKSVKISFNHLMDSLSIINKMAYLVDNEMGMPLNTIVHSGDFSHVILEFLSDFQANMVYHLSVLDTIFDCSGKFIDLNSVLPIVMPGEASRYDIVINEIMADPDPPNGLPEYEYIELFNNSSSYLRMVNWRLQVGSSGKIIPDIIIEPGEFIIFTEDEAANLFGLLARSFGFSSLGLTNSGTSVKLFNQDSIVISAVSYRDDWYGDSEKESGGWSLEQIDPSNPCPGKDNWMASADGRGGSPGSQNSVFDQNPVDPVATKVIPLDSKTFEVYFNQMMDDQSLLNSSGYFVDRGIGNPTQVFTDILDFSKVTLKFQTDIEPRKLYTLSLTEDIKSCIGESVKPDFNILFGIPEMAGYNDILINEVLFNPVDNGVDFVEIYNHSQKIIDLKNLMLGTIDVNQFEPNDTIYKSVSSENDLMLNGNYVVLTSNPTQVMEQYFTPNPDGFIGMSSFPSYNNDKGSVVLSSSDGILIDAFNYNENMHYPLLYSVDGVSLERLSFERPASDPTNWHSASGDCGYATPAYKNSQFTEQVDVDDVITVEPEIFSPDNDGYNDVVNIHYLFEMPGYKASVAIYDARGRLVCALLNNEMLGTSGTFSWDGRTDANQKATIGIYIIYFEAFDLTGNIKKYKKPVVLGGKL